MEMEKHEAVRKNAGGWIKNIDKVEGKVKLYATGECTIDAGRIYVALPATQPLTEELKKKHNIM
jgi:hypothetical protein